MLYSFLDRASESRDVWGEMGLGAWVGVGCALVESGRGMWLAVTSPERTHACPSWLAGEGLAENLLRADTFSCDLFLQPIRLHDETYRRQMCIFCLDIYFYILSGVIHGLFAREIG